MVGNNEKIKSFTHDFDNQVAIVTGAAMGIGKDIAARLHGGGAMVVIADTDDERGEETVRFLGEKTVFIRCDVTDVQQVKHLIGSTVQRFGKLDVIVNNAGVNFSLPEDRVTVDRYPDQTWHKMIRTCMNGTFYCCKEASQIMVEQKSGSIINVASVAGVVALRLQIGFVAAMAAIIKMTEAMACELAPFGIRANTVSPGLGISQETKQLSNNEAGPINEKANSLISFIPQRRLGKNSEIADAVAFLASGQASYINGQNLIVDGGWTRGFNRDF
jgi:3-oxoacyl-[acyl-carrier protein] reductase